MESIFKQRTKSGNNLPLTEQQNQCIGESYCVKSIQSKWWKMIWSENNNRGQQPQQLISSGDITLFTFRMKKQLYTSIIVALAKPK